MIAIAAAAGHQALAGGPGGARLDAVISLGVQQAVGVGPDNVSPSIV